MSVWTIVSISLRLQKQGRIRIKDVHPELSRRRRERLQSLGWVSAISHWIGQTASRRF